MSLLHQIALSCIPGIGPVTAANLIRSAGSAEEVFKMKRREMESVYGVGTRAFESMRNHKSFPRAEKEIDFIQRHQIKPLFILDPEYPRRLKYCPDAPVMLYYKGSANLNCARTISVVGSRNSSDYGREICKQLIQDLQIFNPLVISGLAYGIDSIAHRESLQNDLATLGVLAHGLDRIYPQSHRTLAYRMIENGGLLTEFMSGTIPDRENFPKRNRIIAGLADIVVVVEASLKGGALITAELANSYNRDVFAFPGRINDEYSKGCNYLIKSNKANLVSRIEDIMYMMGWAEQKSTEVQQQLSLLLSLTEEEQVIVELLQAKGALSIDELLYLSKTSQSRLTVILIQLEMKGVLKSLPGKIYKLLSCC